MRRLAVVSAGLSTPSSTRLLADRLASATVRELGAADVTLVEIRDVARDLTDALLTGVRTPALSAAEEAVAQADGVVAVTPVFSASYSGLFKTFFDVLDEGALHGTPVLVGATAGTARHSLVTEHALRPLFTHLHAVVVPTAVFAGPEDWAGPDAAGRTLSGRVDRAAAELAALVRTRPAAQAADPFEEPTPFEELLRRAGTSAASGR